MATVPYSTLQLSNPKALFSSSRVATSPLKFQYPQQHISLTKCRATANEDDGDTVADQTQLDSSSSDPDSFDDRLSQVRVRYRSGQGKKAEVRKTKKGKKGSSGTGSGSGSGVFLPPVPLKEPVSEGLNVEFGFSPFSERINGRIAAVGLIALVLVELATGKGVINYHTPAIILIQIYFMAAASALYLKYEKEKVSVWPQSSPAEK